MRLRWVRFRYTEVPGNFGPDLLREVWAASGRTLTAQRWRPPIDFYETDRDLTVKLELAGMSEDEVEITLYDDALVIEGVRAWDVPGREARFHVVEIPYGPFRLELPLRGPVNCERVTARYERGFLIVHLPKAGERE